MIEGRWDWHAEQIAEDSRRELAAKLGLPLSATVAVPLPGPVLVATLEPWARADHRRRRVPEDAE